MSEKQNSGTNQQVSEIIKTRTFEELEEGITFKVDLRPGHNRLVVQVRGTFVFSM